MGEYSADDRLFIKYMDLNLIPCIPIKIKTIKCGDSSILPEIESRIPEIYWLHQPRLHSH